MDAVDYDHNVLFEARALRKTFPGVVANDNVSFSVGAGEIHALLGENGAGKSTLVKMIYGVLRPDQGEMRLRGAPYAPKRPGDARRAGVGMVFQHFSLFEALTVAENVALGMSEARPSRALRQRICEVSEAYGLPLDPERHVGALSVGERQRVEIVRALLQSPRLLIMDEPTSVLTPHEADSLFATLRKLSAEGISILYISHKLDEIRALCSAATILRRGRVEGRCDPRSESAKSLAEMMIGRALAAPSVTDWGPGEARLSVERLTVPASEPFGVTLSDLNFSLRGGDILGVAGVAGEGQEEFISVLSGETPVRAEAVRLEGRPIGRLGPESRRALGMTVSPEERLGHAAAPEMSLAENTVLTARSRLQLSYRGFIRRQATETFARRIVADFDVRTNGVRSAAKSLSGGNLQKFVIGREILQSPDVLVVAQPTWGVDAGAAGAIRAAIRRLAKDGAAVLVVSQDLDELMEIATLISVMAGGRLSFPIPGRDLTIEQIGRMMGGQASEPETQANLHV